MPLRKRETSLDVRLRRIKAEPAFAGMKSNSQATSDALVISSDRRIPPSRDDSTSTLALLQRLPQKRHRDATLRGKRCAIQPVEQCREPAQVAPHTPQQPVQCRVL